MEDKEKKESKLRKKVADSPTMSVDEQKELYEKQEFLSRQKREFQRDVDARRRYDYEWMVRDMFRRGYHFSRYQPTTQTVILASRQAAKIPINFVAAHMRSIRNQVTSFRPKWEIMPRYSSNDALTQARYAQRFLDYFFDHNKLKVKIKETVTQGLMYSVGGPWEIYYDKEKDEVKVYLLDPFDFYIDRYADILDEAMRCVKAVRTPKQDVINNPEFDPRAVLEITRPDSKLAVSEYKQFIIQAVKQMDQQGEEDSENLILYEGYFVQYDENNKRYIRKMTWTEQNKTPLIYEKYDDDEFPFEMYRADINPKEIYGESWMKHVMPINRVIDNLESSVYEYNHRVAKGRIVVDRDSGVRSIHNVHGEIIAKNKGAEVRALDMPPLPVAVERQIERMVRFQEDISGAHDASLGRIPTGVKSGVGVAELKQADACVDIETEALTKDGWKKYNELKKGQEIYLLDPKTKKSRWGKINWIYWNDKVNADMYEVDTKTMSFLVTPDHPWMTINSRGNWKKEETQNLKNDQKIPTAIESNDIPLTGKYSDDFVELVGWVITEGTYSITKTLQDRGSFDIRIYQSEKNMPEIEKIKSLFNRLGITRKPYISPARGNGTKEWQFMFAKENAQKIRELFPTKSLTIDFVSQLTKKQLNILIDTMILGDGCETQGRTKKRRCFINTNKETIDAFQFACVLLGIPTSIGIKKREKEIHSTCYVVYLKDTPHITVTHLLDGDMKKIKFTGRIWCPNTETGYWLARRNGYIFYTSNTNQDDLVDNLEDFLANVAQKVLRRVSKDYSNYHFVRDLGARESQEKYFVMVGEKSGKKGNKDKKGMVKIGPDWLDLAVIGEDNNIRVTVGSWLGYTKEMMQEKVLKYAETGLINQATALRLLEFGNIDDIVQQTRIEQLLKNSMQQKPGQPNEPDQYSLALTENEMMTNEGKDMPVDAHDDHIVHIAVHQEAFGRGQDELVGKHISLHEMYMGQTPSTDVTGQDQARQTAVEAQQPPPGAGGPPPGGGQPPGMPPGGAPPQGPPPGQGGGPPPGMMPGM